MRSMIAAQFRKFERPVQFGIYALVVASIVTGFANFPFSTAVLLLLILMLEVGADLARRHQSEWPQIDDRTRLSVANSVANMNLRVTIGSYGDTKTKAFGKELASAFEEAGCSVEFRTGFTDPFVGIQLYEYSTFNSDALLRSLEKIGVKVEQVRSYQEHSELALYIKIGETPQ